MKKHTTRITIGIVILSLLFLGFQSVVYAETTSYPTVLTKVEQQLSKTDTLNKYTTLFSQEDSSWYPGFLIVQLIRGVLAFFVVILILLDLIEP